MIRYNKRITIKDTKYGLKVETDRGDKYELSIINASSNSAPITTWWDKQAQTELRRDQMDCIIKEYWRQYSPLDLYLVFKRGEGYSQQHDVMLARDPSNGLWILSTQEHTWFAKGGTDVTFNTDDALGSVGNLDARLEIYEVIDGINDKQHYVSRS